MSVIVVGATMAPYVAKNPGSVLSWLNGATSLANTTREHTGHDVQFFVALETDARGLEPFGDVLRALDRVHGSYWTYSLDDGETHVDTHNRLTRICIGRNLIQRYALNIGASHVLFLDADVNIPADALARLLEDDYPFVGGHVPTYGLDGQQVKALDFGEMGKWQAPEGSDIRLHWNTAGFLLVSQRIFNRVHWRWDAPAQMSDDPAYAFDVQQGFGIPALVDHGVVGVHWPETIPPIEDRYTEDERAFVR